MRGTHWSTIHPEQLAKYGHTPSFNRPPQHHFTLYGILLLLGVEGKSCQEGVQSIVTVVSNIGTRPPESVGTMNNHRATHERVFVEQVELSGRERILVDRLIGRESTETAGQIAQLAKLWVAWVAIDGVVFVR